jgi:hypothetical protein
MSRYTYDSIGRMLTRESGSDLTQFVWDGWDCVREVSGTTDIVYHIPNGLLQSFSLNGVVYQVHMDALSSLRMITDSSGTVVARVEYGAYGEEIFVSAIPALQNFPYRFVGAKCMTSLVWDAFIPIGSMGCFSGGLARVLKFVTTRIAIVSVSAAWAFLAALGAAYCKLECSDPITAEKWCPTDTDPIVDLTSKCDYLTLNIQNQPVISG